MGDFHVYLSIVIVYLFSGDHDAVLVLLLIPRLVAKLELLITQTKEKVYPNMDCSTQTPVKWLQPYPG